MGLMTMQRTHKPNLKPTTWRSPHRRLASWIAVALLWLGGLTVTGCGAPHGLQVHFLDAATLKKVSFLDLALFSTKAACNTINDGNYRDTGGVGAHRMTNTSRGVDIVPVLLKPSDLRDGKEYRAFIGQLGGPELLKAGEKGLEVNLYMLALGTGPNDTKVKLAQGCATVRLIYQKTVTGTITLAPIAAP